MAEINEEFNYDDGLKYAAKEGKFAISKCFKINENTIYKYQCTKSSALNQTYYLQGAFTSYDNNAFGGPFNRFYWGRTSADVNHYNANFRYAPSGSKGTESILPIVYQKYALTPINNPAGSSFPFTVKQTFTTSTPTVYLWYSDADDCCYYSTSGKDINKVKINDGPGVFFIMIGGGASGGNGYASGFISHGGGGGGGGASIIGYLDLKSYANFTLVYVNIGSGGVHNTGSSANGQDGNATYLKYYTNSSHSTSKIIVSCPGGKKGYGGNFWHVGDGGAESDVASLPNDNKRPLWLFGCTETGTSNNGVWTYTGKPGGKGGNNGTSFSTSEKYRAFDVFLKGTHIPLLSNGVYAQGGSSYHTDGDGNGGGGGATLLSYADNSTIGYGRGGHGGEAKSWSWYDVGQDGASGCFQLLTLN